MSSLTSSLQRGSSRITTAALCVRLYSTTAKIEKTQTEKPKPLRKRYSRKSAPRTFPKDDGDTIRIGDVIVSVEKQQMRVHAASSRIANTLEDITIIDQITSSVADELTEEAFRLKKMASTKPLIDSEKTAQMVADERATRLSLIQHLSSAPQAKMHPSSKWVSNPEPHTQNSKRAMRAKHQRDALLLQLQYLHADAFVDITDLPSSTRTFIAMYRYLKTLGCTDDDIIRIAHKYHRLFTLSVEHNMALKVQFLKSVGCDEIAIRSLVRSAPFAFTVSLKRFASKVQFLLALGVDATTLREYMCKPWMSTSTKSLRTRFELFRAMGLQTEELHRLLRYNSPALTYSITTLRVGIMFLIKQGFSVDRLRGLLLTAPGVFAARPERIYRLARTLEMVLGISVDQFYSSFLSRYPQLYYLQPSALFAIFTLLASLGFTSSAIRYLMRNQASFLALEPRYLALHVEYLAAELNFPLTIPLDTNRYRDIASRALPLFDLMHLRLGPRYNAMVFRNGRPVVSNLPLRVSDSQGAMEEANRLTGLYEAMPDPATALSYRVATDVLTGVTLEKPDPTKLRGGPLDMRYVRLLPCNIRRHAPLQSLLDDLVSVQPSPALQEAEVVKDDAYQARLLALCMEGDALARDTLNSNRIRLQAVLQRTDVTNYEAILDEEIFAQVRKQEERTKNSSAKTAAGNADSASMEATFGSSHPFTHIPLTPEEADLFDDVDADEREDSEVELHEDAAAIEDESTLVNGRVVDRHTGEQVVMDLELDPSRHSYLYDHEKLDSMFPWLPNRAKETPEEAHKRAEDQRRASQLVVNIVGVRPEELSNPRLAEDDPLFAAASFDDEDAILSSSTSATRVHDKPSAAFVNALRSGSKEAAASALAELPVRDVEFISSAPKIDPVFASAPVTAMGMHLRQKAVMDTEGLIFIPPQYRPGATFTAEHRIAPAILQPDGPQRVQHHRLFRMAKAGAVDNYNEPSGAGVFEKLVVGEEITGKEFNIEQALELSRREVEAPTEAAMEHLNTSLNILLGPMKDRFVNAEDVDAKLKVQEARSKKHHALLLELERRKAAKVEAARKKREDRERAAIAKATGQSVAIEPVSYAKPGVEKAAREVIDEVVETVEDVEDVEDVDDFDATDPDEPGPGFNTKKKRRHGDEVSDQLPVLFADNVQAELSGVIDEHIPRVSHGGLRQKRVMCELALERLRAKKMQLEISRSGLSQVDRARVQAALVRLNKRIESLTHHKGLPGPLPAPVLAEVARSVDPQALNAMNDMVRRDKEAPLVTVCYGKASILLLDAEQTLMPKITALHTLATVWSSALGRMTGVDPFQQSRLSMHRSYAVNSQNALAYSLETSPVGSSSFYSFLNLFPGMPHTQALANIYRRPPFMSCSLLHRIMPRFALMTLRAMGHRMDSRMEMHRSYAAGLVPKPVSLAAMEKEFRARMNPTRFINPFTVVSPIEAEQQGYTHDQIIFEPADPRAPEGSPESRDRWSAIIAGYVPGADVVQKKSFYLKRKMGRRDFWGKHVPEHVFYDPFFTAQEVLWPESYEHLHIAVQAAKAEHARTMGEHAPPLEVELPDWLDSRASSSQETATDEIDEELQDTLDSLSMADETKEVISPAKLRRRLVFKYTFEFPEVTLPSAAAFSFLPQMKPALNPNKIYTFGPKRPTAKEIWDIPRVGHKHPLPEDVPEAQLFSAAKPFETPFMLEQPKGDAFFDELPDIGLVEAAGHSDFFSDRLCTPELFIPMQRDLRMLSALMDRARRRQRFNQEQGFEPLYPLGVSPKGHLHKEFFAEHRKPELKADFGATDVLEE